MGVLGIVSGRTRAPPDLLDLKNLPNFEKIMVRGHAPALSPYCALAGASRQTLKNDIFQF